MRSLISIIVISFAFGSPQGEAQIISTIAGNGIAGYSGDGGSATTAMINNPHGIAVDNYGNLYIADLQNSCIRKVSSSGIIKTIAGTGIAGYSGDSGPATLAKLNLPFHVATDYHGNVYISDNMNSRIRKVDSMGVITTVAGNGINGYSGDGAAATSAELNYPGGICIDALGNMFITDQYNNRIRKINITTGIISTIAGTGTAGYSGDGGPATSAHLNRPNYVCVDNSGNVFFTDNHNHCVRKISTTGVITTVAGTGSGGYIGDGMAATISELNYPGGISIDNSGNLLIADYYNNRLRVVNTGGIIHTLAGTGVAGYSGDGSMATLAELNNAVDVAVDPAGNIFIADYVNNRIRKIISGNHAPYFTGGHTQSLSVCINESDMHVPINLLLAVNDTDSGQTETWNLITPPTHGTVLASFSTISTGSTMIPVGLTYTPTGTYVGPDMFKVRVTDGIAYDTTTINVMVNPYPDAGVISGVDSICPGETVTLTESATGGTWSSSNSLITNIAGYGTVTGINPGRDTIVYTVINPCGIVSAIFPLEVKSFVSCHTGISNTSLILSEQIYIHPNPNAGELHVSLPTEYDLPTDVIVINITGEKVFEKNSVSNHKIDIKLDVDPGIYILTLINASGRHIERFTILK